MNDTWTVTIGPETEYEPTKPARVPLSGTDQQRAFWDEILTGDGNVVLSARAGTGKSTSCREGMHRTIEASPNAVIRYACFNKKLADEFAERCPEGVEVGTLHRFGFQALQRPFKSQLDQYKTYTILDGIGAKDLKRYVRKSVSSLVSAAKNMAIRPEQAGLWKTLDDLVTHFDIETWGRYHDQVIDWTVEVLSKSAEMTSLIDFDDMLWLPWIHGVRFPTVDFLYLDESQDLSPVQHALLPFMNPEGRTIAVGDPFQCQPAGTMVKMSGGEAKPIEEIVVGDKVISFCRRSAAMVGRVNQGREVLATASRPYAGFLYTIGTDFNETRCTPNHRWVTRFSSRDADTFVTYLMRKGDRFRVGWCQLFNSQGSLHLGQRARIERADSAWILGVHKDRTDASIQESVVAARYGLPTITFEPVEGARHLTREAIDRVFGDLASSDPLARANRCLGQFGRDMEFPFYTVDFHQKQGRTTIFVTQACNLIPGLMMIPVYTGAREPTWESIDHIEGTFVIDKTVHSLNVEGTETYVADGLVTHNSIYAFRGADSESIPRLIEATSARTMPLTVSFRCPHSHVALARELVPDFEAHPDSPDGTIEEADLSAVQGAELGDLVLCRSNAPIIAACLKMIRNRRRAVVRGRAIGDQLIGIANRIEASTIEQFVRGANEWLAKEVARLECRDGIESQIEQVGDQVHSLIAVADTCGSPAEVPGLIRSLFSDDDAANRVTFSTVHRAKGSEARRVYYIQIPYSERRDKRRPVQPWESDQRRNLRYVGLSRSLDTLILVSDTTRR